MPCLASAEHILLTFVGHVAWLCEHPRQEEGGSQGLHRQRTGSQGARCNRRGTAENHPLRWRQLGLPSGSPEATRREVGIPDEPAGADERAL